MPLFFSLLAVLKGVAKKLVAAARVLLARGKLHRENVARYGIFTLSRGDKFPGLCGLGPGRLGETMQEILSGGSGDAGRGAVVCCERQKINAHRGDSVVAREKRKPYLGIARLRDLHLSWACFEQCLGPSTPCSGRTEKRPPLPNFRPFLTMLSEQVQLARSLIDEHARSRRSLHVGI